MTEAEKEESNKEAFESSHLYRYLDLMERGINQRFDSNTADLGKINKRIDTIAKAQNTKVDWPRVLKITAAAMPIVGGLAALLMI